REVRDPGRSTTCYCQHRLSYKIGTASEVRRDRHRRRSTTGPGAIAAQFEIIPGARAKCGDPPGQDVSSFHTYQGDALSANEFRETRTLGSTGRPGRSGVSR